MGRSAIPRGQLIKTGLAHKFALNLPFPHPTRQAVHSLKRFD